MNPSLLSRQLVIAALVASLVNVAGAETIRLSPDQDWFAVLSGDQLKPGDEVVLAPGTYTDARKLVLSHRGTAEHPIVICGPSKSDASTADASAAVFRRPDAKQNTIHLHGCQYLELRDLEITGGAAGIRIGSTAASPAKHLTLERLHIHHVGGVAVTANYPGILVYGTDGRKPNLIEHNVIWNSGDHGIQAASEAIIRHNVIRNASGADIYSNHHQSARVGNLSITDNTLLSKVSIRIAGGEPFSGPIEISGNRYAGQLRVPEAERVRRLNLAMEK
ncbi:right-handed parallel beta-helix repeat-containing protein [Roseimaritima sediminicola]|uniref:right-handed parallel beta-helix repeat-containing protein n=1 Tax=Roseimaritima sediminicola TaxID=2662066 RepID=UPI001298504B|nr:right-handed parallel beta-helix repeat-containing protein [Roseimaritima sediminicola]